MGWKLGTENMRCQTETHLVGHGLSPTSRHQHLRALKAQYDRSASKAIDRGQWFVSRVYCLCTVYVPVVKPQFQLKPTTERLSTVANREQYSMMPLRGIVVFLCVILGRPSI